MPYCLEICANSVQSAVNAQHGGAQRVELCDNLWEGGTTPSIGTIKRARQLLSIDLYVLFRPRGGDFVYSPLEFSIIKEDILQAKALGIDGVVSGVLLPDGSIDDERTRELVKLSHPLPFTFHRAFDLVHDPQSAMETLISCGVQRILTSGMANGSMNGLGILKELNQEAKDRIVIMPGGGITSQNIVKIAQETGCCEFHCSAKSQVKNNVVDTTVRMNSTTEISEEYRHESNPNTVAKIIDILHQI